jgi:hypothetical protein
MPLEFGFPDAFGRRRVICACFFESALSAGAPTSSFQQRMAAFTDVRSVLVAQLGELKQLRKADRA